MLMFFSSKKKKKKIHRRLFVVALVASLIGLLQNVTLHYHLVSEMSNLQITDDNNNMDGNNDFVWRPPQQKHHHQPLQQQQQQQQQRSSSSFSDDCSIRPGYGIEGKMGLQALLKMKISTTTITEETTITTTTTTTQKKQRRRKLLCIVMIDSTQHETILKAIVDTYASYCDGFLAASNQTDMLLHAKDLFSSSSSSTTNTENMTIHHHQQQQQQHEEEWYRTIQLWKYVYHTYNNFDEQNRNNNSFDAYFVGQADTYIIPENAHALVSEFDDNDIWDSQPLYIGGAVVPSRKTPETRYCGNGAGYILNQQAIKALVLATTTANLTTNYICSSSTIDNNNNNKNNDGGNDNRVPSSSPQLPADQRLARCLFQAANIQCRKTSEKTKLGSLRFLEFGIDYQATWNNGVQGPIKVKPLEQYHHIHMHPGIAGISKQAVGLHLVNGTRPLTTSITNSSSTLLLQQQQGKENNYQIIASAIRRVHAVVRGYCEKQWDQPITAIDDETPPSSSSSSSNTVEGYVADPTWVRRNKPATSNNNDDDVCDVPFGHDVEGPNGYVGLKKIQIATSEMIKSKKVLCMIYTHSNQHHRIQTIAETYGSKCDGFIAASNQTKKSIGAVHIRHEGPEEYGNMWLKVRSMWQYVYDHYRNDFDYFHIGGDDHFVIPENLKFMAMELETKYSQGHDDGTQQQQPLLFMGGSMIDFPRKKRRYCGGGSGYTLNREALVTLVEDLLPTCRPHFESPQEDRMIATCFRKLQLSCMDTNDKNGEWRYHQDSVEFHATWTHDEPSVWRADSLEQAHGIISKEKLGQISTSSVSFHLKSIQNVDRAIRRYHAILYGSCG